jgi:hypothetical protein
MEHQQSKDMVLGVTRPEEARSLHQEEKREWLYHDWVISGIVGDRPQRVHRGWIFPVSYHALPGCPPANNEVAPQYFHLWGEHNLLDDPHRLKPRILKQEAILRKINPPASTPIFLDLRGEISFEQGIAQFDRYEVETTPVLPSKELSQNLFWWAKASNRIAN